MRKLSWACEHAALHHALASCGITEGGVSKKHVNEAGFSRTVSILDELVTRGYGSYYLELNDETNLVTVKTYAETCITRWRFTYPDWKLVTMNLSRCHCRQA